jgi:anti-anti-sigma factor
MPEKTTQVKVDESNMADGVAVTVLRFSGDITSLSKDAVLGTYHSLPSAAKRILLDMSKVDYINSSGIALVIQMLMLAGKGGQTIQTFGLSAHFRKVFAMVGITKYTKIHSDETSAYSAFFEQSTGSR